MHNKSSTIFIVEAHRKNWMFQKKSLTMDMAKLKTKRKKINFGAWLSSLVRSPSWHWIVSPQLKTKQKQTHHSFMIMLFFGGLDEVLSILLLSRDIFQSKSVWDVSFEDFGKIFNLNYNRKCTRRKKVVCLFDCF